MAVITIKLLDTIWNIKGSARGGLAVKYKVLEEKKRNSSQKHLKNLVSTLPSFVEKLLDLHEVQRVRSYSVRICE